MKIRTCAALLIAMLALSLLAGCASSAVKALDDAEDAVEARLDAVEDAVEEAIVQAVLPEPTAAHAVETAPPAQTAPSVPTETNPLSLPRNLCPLSPRPLPG